MTAVLGSIIIGYLLGCLNPAAFLSWLKKKDVRQQGTGNLGATNTMLVMGKKYGALVMAFDIAKAYTAVRLARRLYPLVSLAGLIAGAAAVLGHIFPFYLKFQGGKGLAALGGLVLGVDPILFPILLTVGLAAMFLVDYGYALPVTAATLFPVLFGLHHRSVSGFLVSSVVCGLVVYQNLKTMRLKTEVSRTSVRDFAKKLFKR